jgi:hypothetical protein
MRKSGDASYTVDAKPLSASVNLAFRPAMPAPTIAIRCPPPPRAARAAEPTAAVAPANPARLTNSPRE